VVFIGVYRDRKTSKSVVGQWPMLLYIKIKIGFSCSRSQWLCVLTCVQSVAARILGFQFWNPLEKLPMRA